MKVPLFETLGFGKPGINCTNPSEENKSRIWIPLKRLRKCWKIGKEREEVKDGKLTKKNQE